MAIDDIKRLYPTVNIGQVLNILPERNAIFITNPKAGCSTVKLMLFKAHTGDLELDPKSVHEIHPLPLPRDIGWPKVDAMLSGGAYLFTFVRDPVARAVSAYADKIVRQRFRFAHMVQRTLGRAEDPDDLVSFGDFVTALELQRPEDMDPHWRPQHINVMHGAIAYNRVGRLENFDADWSSIRAETGIPDVPMVHRNRRAARIEVSATDAEAARLREIYREDCALFGY